MSNMLLQEISLKDNGYSKGIKSAQDALSKLAQENGVANVSFRNTNKEVNAAKRYFTSLTTEYEKLSDEAKKSEFGKAIHQQMTQAEKDLQEMYEATEKVNAKLKEMQETAKKKVNIKSEGGSGFDMNKMVGGVLNKAGFGEAAGALESLGSVMGGGVAMGAAAATAGIAAAGYAVKEIIDVTEQAIAKSAEFGQSMSQLGAITGVSGKGLESMREQVMNVGKDTNVAFTEVARNFALVGSALPELLKNAEGMEEVSRASITLSKAGLMPLEGATDALTSTMAQFDKGAEEAANVVDVLANASQLGSADINSVAETLKRCGTAANAAGVELNQAAAMTEVLASKGLKGAEAGTALRNVLMNMSTKGIDEINPKVVGVEQALKNLKEHASDATWMVQTFGQEGATAASIIANGLPQYQELVEGLDKVGTASQMAAQNGANLATQWEETKTKWDNFLSSLNVDGSNGPLMVAVQQIQNIISALEDMFRQMGESQVMSDMAEYLSASFAELGQLLSSTIEIVGDVIDVVFECTDAAGGLSIAFDTLTAVVKVVTEVLWAIEAVIWAVKKGISICIEHYVEFKKELSSTASKIPLLSAIKSAIETICSWIQKAIDLWNEFKGTVQEEMDKDRGRKKEGDKPKSNTSSTKKDNTEDNPEVQRQKGIIEKLNDELKDLKDKKEKATSKAEIDRLNKQIKSKQKELDKYNASTSKSGSSKTETPEQKYNNKMAQINAKQNWKLYDNENEANNEKKALEEKVKAIDSYINELTKDEKAIKANVSKVKALTKEQNKYKNRIKAVTKSIEDFTIIRNANNDYKNTIDQINQDRKNAWTSEDEYNERQISALKELINSYKKVNNRNDELVDEINTKQKEISNIEFSKQLKEFDIAVAALMEDFDRAKNGMAKGNSYYNETRTAGATLSIKLDEFTVKEKMKPLYDEIKKSTDETKRLQEILDFINSHYNEMIHLGISKKDLDTLYKLNDVTKADTYQITSLNAAINTLDKQLKSSKFDDFMGLTDADKQIQWMRTHIKEFRKVLGDKKAFSTIMKIRDVFHMSAEETSAFNKGVQKLAESSGDWKKEWFGDVQTLLSQNSQLLSSYIDKFHTLADAENTVSNYEISIDYAKIIDQPKEIVKKIYKEFDKTEVFIKLTYDNEYFQYLKQQIKKFEEDNQVKLKTEVTPENLNEIEKELKSFNKPLSDSLDYALKHFRIEIERTKLKFNPSSWSEFIKKLEEKKVKLETELDYTNIDEIENELKNNKIEVDQETLNELLSILKQFKQAINDDVENVKSAVALSDPRWLKGTNKGDASNYSLNVDSYDQVSKRANNYKTGRGGVSSFLQEDVTKNMEKGLDEMLNRYQEMEKLLVEINEKNEKLGANIDTSRLEADMNTIVSEIDKMHDRIQERLKFQVQVEGFQNALAGLSSLASYGNTIATFADSWKQAGEASNEASEVFQKTMLVISLVQGAIEAVNTVMTIANGIQNLFNIGKVAGAAASTEQAVAEGVLAGEEAAAIAPTVAATAANKALESSVLDLAAAEIFAAHASIPFAGVGIAGGLIGGMMAAMTAQHAASLALVAMANGGIVGGDSFHGDSTLIRANKGEMILNNLEQKNLFDALKYGIGNPMGNSEVEFKLRGTDLIGLMNNTNAKKSRIR